MDINDLSKQLRMILYRHNDCSIIATEFGRILQIDDIDIIYTDKTILVNTPFFRYSKTKNPIKIYQTSVKI